MIENTLKSVLLSRVLSLFNKPFFDEPQILASFLEVTVVGSETVGIVDLHPVAVKEAPIVRSEIHYNARGCESKKIKTIINLYSSS